MADTAIREAVGVFHDEKSLQAAVDALLIVGFDRSYLRLLAGQHSIESKLGHRFEKVSDLEDDPEVPTQAYIGTDSRTDGKGVLVGILFHVGAAFARFLEQRHAHRLQEQLDRGGLVLSARTLSREDERRAIATPRTNGADDVHVHDLQKPHYAQDGGVSRDMSFMKSLGM